MFQNHSDFRKRMEAIEMEYDYLKIPIQPYAVYLKETKTFKVNFSSLETFYEWVLPNFESCFDVMLKLTQVLQLEYPPFLERTCSLISVLCFNIPPEPHLAKDKRYMKILMECDDYKHVNGI